MKNTILMSALAATVVLGGTLQGVAKDEAGGMGHGPRHSFEELDANADGKITPEEMAAHRAARFTAADADGDSELSLQEMTARMQSQMQERMAKRAAQMIERADTDNSGALSLEEMQAMRGGGRMMARADTDEDGAISKAEFDKIKERMGRHGKGHGHGKGHDQDK